MCALNLITQEFCASFFGDHKSSFLFKLFLAQEKWDEWYFGLTHKKSVYNNATKNKTQVQNLKREI
jgi:hypothetical protein